MGYHHTSDTASRAYKRRRRRKVLIIIASVVVIGLLLRNVIAYSVHQAQSKLDDIYGIPELEYISQQEKEDLIGSITEDSVHTLNLVRVGKENVNITLDEEPPWWLTMEEVTAYFKALKDLIYRPEADK